MRKYCIFLFVLLLALGLSFAANAEEAELTVYQSGDYKYILLADGTAQIIDYSGRAAELIVADTLDGYSVSGIRDYAFAGCYSLTAVTLPDSITEMGANPFRYCEQLTNIQVSPDHPVFATIDGVLFNKEEKKLVCYPGGFTAKEYQVPKGIRSIGDYAFYYCKSLAAITLPEGLTSIGDSAFSDCYSLTSITLPDSITEMGANPFAYCEKLTNIQVSPDHPVFATIDRVLFNKTEKKLVCYPGGFTATEYQVPKGIRSIGDDAFCGCSSLTAITLPEGITSIGDSAFCRCSSLTAITLPESVTSIGDEAFSFCSSLTAITLPEGVTNIGDEAFYYCKSLTAITLPESVTSIGDSAFFGCSSLAAITLPEGLTSIGDMAFRECSGLIAISLSEGITSIGARAFYYCSSLTAITLPEGLTSIGDAAFFECSSLAAITLPEGLTSIGDMAFCNCSSLTAVSLPESLKSIGTDAFDDCPKNMQFTVVRDSYAAKWCKENGLNYTFPDSLDWLND